VHKPAASSGKDAAQPLHIRISGYVMWLPVLPAARPGAKASEPAQRVLIDLTAQGERDFRTPRADVSHRRQDATAPGLVPGPAGHAAGSGSGSLMP
jgi:hypothetical protein